MTNRKLNEVIYNKMFLQSEEAKEQGMIRLGSAVMGNIGPEAGNGEEKYSSGELDRDVYEGLWKLAMNVVGYHGVESADIEKMNEAINVVAETFVKEMERAIGVEEGKIGPKDVVVGEEKSEKA